MAGGFGRFQWFSSILLILNYTTGSWLYYGLAFLEYYPQYQRLVNGQWVDTSREYICDNDLP